MKEKTVFFDLETTGLIPEIQVPGKRLGTIRKERACYIENCDDYPYIVTIAWKVNHDVTKYYILNQEGRGISHESMEIHGITNEMAELSPHTFLSILPEFINDIQDCKIVVGHNIHFDTAILKANLNKEIKLGRVSDILRGVLDELIHKDKRICTMRCSAKLHPTGKWMKLSELHETLLHAQFDAHHSLADVNATYRCYLKMQELDIVPREEEIIVKELN